VAFPIDDRGCLEFKKIIIINKIINEKSKTKQTMKTSLYLLLGMLCRTGGAQPQTTSLETSLNLLPIFMSFSKSVFRVFFGLSFSVGCALLVSTVVL